jgi:hypothetical protein
MNVASLIKQRKTEMKCAKPKQRERLRQRVRVLEVVKLLRKGRA